MLKRWQKVALGLVAALVVVVIGFISYVQLALPDGGPVQPIRVAATPERVARGKYLAYHVTLCMDCHSTRDWGSFSGPLVPGTDGKGGEVFDQNMGFPGRYVSQNITPAGIGSWSDGEVLRAFTCGVGQDGRAMFPVMPYPEYASLDSNDAYSIIAFIRTLKPIEATWPKGESDFPMNLIINTIPKPVQLGTGPKPSDSLAYGKYLTTVAGCIVCHSQEDKGVRLQGLEFAGGREFRLPGGVLRSSNITPDDKTGIGAWSQEQFFDKFRGYLKPQAKVGPTDYNSIMPWTMYAGMSDADLSSIYQYLISIKPTYNPVARFTPVQ